MAPVVRRLQKADADLIVSIASLFAGNVVSADHARDFLENDANVLLTATIDGELAGFLLAHCLDRFKDLRKKLFIYEIDVLPSFRRRGAGRALIAKVLEIGRLESIDTVFVLTNRSNASANGLYRAMGAHAVNDDDVMYTFDI